MDAIKKIISFNPEEYETDKELILVIELALKQFLVSEIKVLEFPSSLTKEQRKFVHRFATNYHNLKAKSKGKKFRFVTVRKKPAKIHDDDKCKLVLDENSHTVISTLMQKYPVTNKERQELLPPIEKRTNLEVSEYSSNTFGQLVHDKPMVPNFPNKTDIIHEARNLPVWSLKNEILNAINEYQIVLVCGETGSGKTTQIPQMILEEATTLKRPCKILCTQPRRISAISVSERISAERGEKLGGTIGYQIRHEGRTSTKTLLTFCTTGIVLRLLMKKNEPLSGITHIFIDEVHERDKLMDFLLIALRELLPSYKNLKVVLMSANLDVDLYSKYFNTCPIVHVPVVSYPVKQYFLDDILEFTKYSTSNMLKLYNRLKKDQEKSSSSLKNISNIVMDNVPPYPYPEDRCYSPSTKQQMDHLLEEAFLTGEDGNFSNILYFIMSEDVSPDYQHTANETTPLMVAAGRGRMDIMDILLSLHASLELKSSNGWTASDWASSTNQSQAVEKLESLRKLNETFTRFDNLNCDDDSNFLDEKNLIVKAYCGSINVDEVDNELIYSLITKIHTCEPPGGILVFLPGYDDIIYIRDRILAEDKIFNEGKNIALYCLHSSMQSSEQKKVFQNMPARIRKIVLSTNIAETSVTINDIIYIVDCGMHKQMTYDALTSASCLRTVNISQASVNQRKGRAGRCQPGIAYHLMTRDGYEALQPHQTPEILCTPLQDLCLHSKYLSFPNVPIADFLSKAPEPPSVMAVKKAVDLLKKMDALDEWEDVTELGHHLMDLSLPPHLGKMVLIACILKCLDPVLTIAAFLSYKDPFILPVNFEDKLKSKLIRKKLANNNFSDHYLLLNIYKGYEKAGSNYAQRNWCRDRFISASTLEQVGRTRFQILTQLHNSGFLKMKCSSDLREVNINSDNWSLVKAALLSGMYPSLLKLDRRSKIFKSQSYNQLRLHRNCAIAEAFDDGDVSSYSKTIKHICVNIRTDWFFYDELYTSFHQTVVRKVTPISPLCVILFSGPIRLPVDSLSQSNENAEGSDSEDEVSGGTNISVSIDSWLHFSGDPTSSSLLLQLRHKLQSFILRKLKSPFKAVTVADDEILQVLANLLMKEDNNLGLLSSDVDNEANCNKFSQPQYKNWERQEQQKNGDKSKVNPVPPVTSTNTITLSASKPIACSDSSIIKGTQHNNRDVIRKNNLTENKQLLETRYFIIKYPTFRQIEIAQNIGSVSFTPGTERKLMSAVQKQNTILIFALNRGKQFFGYAKFTGRKCEQIHHSDFNLDHSNQVYKIHFIRSNLFFNQTRHLLNSLNENLQIHMCRDGQEVERNVGDQLIKILNRSMVTPSTGNAYMNDSSVPRRPFLPHYYQPHPPPFLPPHPNHRPDFAGPYPRPFRGYGFGGSFRGVHRGFRRGGGHS